MPRLIFCIGVFDLYLLCFLFLNTVSYDGGGRARIGVLGWEVKGEGGMGGGLCEGFVEDWEGVSAVRIFS